MKKLVLVIVTALLLGGVLYMVKDRSQEISVVFFWNTTALSQVKIHETTPPETTLVLAVLHQILFHSLAENQSLSTRAQTVIADAGAAWVVDHYFPENAIYVSRIRKQYSSRSDQQYIEQGITLAQEVIETVDVSDPNSQHVVRAEGDIEGPGEWRLTPPDYEYGMNPDWVHRTTMVADNNDLTIQNPPVLESGQYVQEWNETYLYGGVASEYRTLEQREIAHRWADGLGSETPPGHWNDIARATIHEDATEQERAYILMVLNTALYDASIITWREKYRHNFWRPIDAIHNADMDGNASTSRDFTWLPLLENPNFPEYPSGHSTFSAAAAEVLTTLVGDTEFTVEGGLVPTKQFNSFWDAARESGQSRIYGGIHFQSANQQGQLLGKTIAENTLDYYQNQELYSK